MEIQTANSQATMEQTTGHTTEIFKHFIDNVSISNFPSNLSMNATDQGNYFQRDEQLAKVEIGMLSTILYLALFGNIFVLVVLRLRRQTLTRMQWFIVHLSLADIFVAVFNIFPQLLMDITNHFYGDDFLCRSVKYLSVVAMYASSYVLVMAAVDRYVSICHPLTNQTLSPKRVHLMILLAWSLSFLFSMPQIFIFRLTEMDGRGYECYAVFQPIWGLKAWVTWIFLSVYALPFLLITFCYARICLVVWVSVDSKQGGTWSSNSGSCRSGVAGSGAGAGGAGGFSSSLSGRRSDGKRFIWSRPFRHSSSGHKNSAFSRLDKNSDSNGHLAREDAQSLRCLTTNQSKPRGHRRGMSKSKVKTVKLTLAVVLCYLVCWAPFFVVNMMTVWDDTIVFEGPVMTIIALLASLNSCTNPWIYLAFSGRVCHPCGARSSNHHRGISRSWTRSTHVVTASSYESEAPRCRNSVYELSRHTSCGRDVGSWTRDNLGRTSSHSSSVC